MICQEVIELMQRYVDRDLNQTETLLMSDHVEQCPDCAAMLIRLQKLSSELEQLPRVVPKFSLVDAILPELEKLDISVPVDKVPIPARSRRPGRAMFGKIAGVVALGITAGFLLFSQEGPWSPVQKSELSSSSAPMAGQDQSPDITAYSLDESNKQKMGALEKGEIELESTSDPLRIAGQLETPKQLETSEQLEPTVKDQFGLSEDQPFEPSTAPLAMPSSSDADGNAAQPEGIEGEVTMTSTSRESANAPEEGVALEGDTEKMLHGITNEAREAPAALALLSPDGHWRAIAMVDTGTIQVYDTSNESLLFQSELRAGSISHLTWDAGSQLLTYIWTDGEGKESLLAFDVATNKEINR